MLTPVGDNISNTQTEMDDAIDIPNGQKDIISISDNIQNTSIKREVDLQRYISKGEQMFNHKIEDYQRTRFHHQELARK